MDLRERIRGQLLKRQTVPVPEWGCEVTVRKLNGLERLQLDRLQATLPDDMPDSDKNYRFGVRLVIAAAVNEDGSPLFTPNDEPWLLQADPEAMARLVEVAARLSTLTEKDLEDARKNSEAAHSNGLPAACA